MKEEWMKKWKNPGREYRPIPFWSWNDCLETEELKRQIHEMADQGMGGFFMHARGGLVQEYLGEEWQECIAAGIKEGEKCGLDAWIYDEEGWPSGFAGGRIPKMGEAYQAKFLSIMEFTGMEEGCGREAGCGLRVRAVDCEDPVEGKSILAAFIRKVDGTCLRIPGEGIAGEGVILMPGETLEVIIRNVQRTYIDVMNKEAVEAFIKVTHQEYYNRYGEAFGKEMKGFFTDEPRFTCNRPGDLPWSDGLEEEYRKRYGSSLTEQLLCLWKPWGDYRRVRYDFWKMVNDLFVHHYMETLYLWCREHSCMLTGHIMMEESIFSQMTGTGGVMPFYEYEHIPGIDWLRRRIETPVIAKQVGSAACQLGQKRVLTESFALSGWNLSFEEMKWILEWQYVNGVNLLCQHLAAYSLKGSRKRDYPPSIFYQQSWWKEFGKFADYAARLGMALGEGNQIADVLLLHPMRSGYVCYDGTRTSQIRELDDRFREMTEYLSQAHVGFHYGDETLLYKYGRVEKPAAAKQPPEDKKAGLWVGQVCYRTVILPCMYSMDETTLDLLLEFAKGKGMILSAGAFPEFTNGPAQKLSQLRTYVRKVRQEEIRSLLEQEGLVSASICEKGQEAASIGLQIRQTQEGIVLFLVNHSQTENVLGEVTVYRKECEARLLHADSGESIECAVRSHRDTYFQLSFAPMQSHLVLLKKKGRAQSREAGKEDGYLSLTGTEKGAVDYALRPGENIRCLELGSSWEILEQSDNSLTLDICRYRIGDGELEGTLPVIHLMKLLLDRQQDTKIELFYDFTIEMDLEEINRFLLALEDREQYRISVNGVFVGEKGSGWWKDRAFRTVDIRKYIREGANTLKLEGVFHQDASVYEVLYGKGIYETEKNRLTYNMEMEAVYLVGDFGVYSRNPFTKGEHGSYFTGGPFVIDCRKKMFTHNDFTSQGLLFFAGELKVSQKLWLLKRPGERICLDCKKPNVPVMELSVNGKVVKTMMFAPFWADITDVCLDGENTVELKLFASNRNLLGPHHHIRGESYGVGPYSFTGQWSWVERDSEADGTQFGDRTVNYWTEDYAFLPFGPGSE